MKTILALVDFSDVTARVLQYAETFARVFGSQVVLMHVIPPDPVAVDYVPPPTPNQDQVVKDKLMELRDSLAGLGLSVTAECSQGAMVETIVAYSRSAPPDFIIMGSHGHGALYNLLVGSVTAGVLKAATCPILVVPSLLKAS